MRNLTTSPRQSESSEVNLTPMLDVVFILLIFFIVTASFLEESGITLNRSEGAEQIVRPAESILVEIDADDRILIHGRHIDPRAVTANIKRQSAENPDATVIVMPDADSSNDSLVRVLDASRAAGRFDIAIATHE